MTFDRTSIDDRIVIVGKLSEAMYADQTKLYLGDLEIMIQDIQEDYESFCEQARFYIRSGLLWPCIALDRVDVRDNSYFPRFAPIDAPIVTETHPSKANMHKVTE